jgi:hypothetical protein
MTDGDDGAADLNGVEAFDVFEMIYVVHDFDVNVFIVVRRELRSNLLLKIIFSNT